MAYYGKGTSGQALVDQTAPSMSNWQAVTTPGPNKVFSTSDDFISGVSSSFIGSLGWGDEQGGTTSYSICSAGVDSSHPGTLVLNTAGAYAGHRLYLSQNTTVSQLPLVLGGGSLSINWVCKLSQLSNGTNRFYLAIGIGDMTGDTPNNGVFFQYIDNINSGNWQICASSASVQTSTNTSVAADTNWHNFGIVVNAAASSISYTIDGVSVGTVTTNIPTVQLSPSFSFNNNGSYTSGTQTVIVDLFYMTLTLTTAR